MKLDLSQIDLTSFKLKEGSINGKKVFLINPCDFDCKWTTENLNLRSLIVDEEGNIKSNSLKKFFNFSENPDLYPSPEKYDDWVLEGKHDGSLLICDWMFSDFNARTRGTLSYKSLLNAADFDFVFNKYPNIINVCRANPDDTFLFEITTPNNIVVIKYQNEPDIKFLGFINKPTGLYYPAYSQEGILIKNIIGCESPITYQIQGNLTILSNEVKDWIGREGIVLKYNYNQNFVKLKSDWYNLRHRLKSDYASIEKLLDLWIIQNKPSYSEFHNFIESIDYELSVSCDDNIKKIIMAYDKVNDNISRMKEVVIPLLSLSRKDSALIILEKYKCHSSYLFKLLSGKELDDRDIRKLLLTFID